MVEVSGNNTGRVGPSECTLGRGGGVAGSYTRGVGMSYIETGGVGVFDGGMGRDGRGRGAPGSAIMEVCGETEDTAVVTMERLGMFNCTAGEVSWLMYIIRLVQMTSNDNKGESGLVTLTVYRRGTDTGRLSCPVVK